jgi:hypothetical protein
MGSMKGSSSHILCCSQQPKKKEKEAGKPFFWGDWDFFGLGRIFYFQS